MNNKKSRQADWQCAVVREVQSMTNDLKENRYAVSWMHMGSGYTDERDAFELEITSDELIKR